MLEKITSSPYSSQFLDVLIGYAERIVPKEKKEALFNRLKSYDEVQGIRMLLGGLFERTLKHDQELRDSYLQGHTTIEQIATIIFTKICEDPKNFPKTESEKGDPEEVLNNLKSVLEKKSQ